MVNCPTCGWSMKLRKEYESGGYVFGHYYCATAMGSKEACPTTVKVKAPTEWMVATGRWKSEPLSSKSE